MAPTQKPNKSTPRQWHLIDLDGFVLGRAASKIAYLLIGKHKPDYLPNLDRGDYIVAINAAKMKFTGRKLTQKIYSTHSMYPGGLKQLTLAEMMKKSPIKVLEIAVKGMLPKNRLQTPRLRRLKAFTNSEHPYINKFSIKQ